MMMLMVWCTSARSANHFDALFCCLTLSVLSAVWQICRVVPEGANFVHLPLSDRAAVGAIDWDCWKRWCYRWWLRWSLFCTDHHYHYDHHQQNDFEAPTSKLRKKRKRCLSVCLQGAPSSHTHTALPHKPEWEYLFALSYVFFLFSRQISSPSACGSTLTFLFRPFLLHHHRTHL